MDSSRIFAKISELQRLQTSFALVTVIAAKGSTPRGIGAKMIVLENGRIFGTIGGSAVESLIVQDALKAIRENKIIRRSHNLNDSEKNDTGMICGGTMEFYIEPIKTAPRLYIFGGGHCGQPLARTAAQVGFECIVVEDRPEFATKELYPDNSISILNATPENAFEQISFGENDYVAIVTRSHELDYQVLKNVIRNRLKYIGLIGSKAKKSQIFKKLEHDGISKHDLARVHCPIGLAINAESPEEIAVSIVAELIAVKNSAKSS